MFRVFKQSVIGASHVRKGIPCEDYGIKYSDEKYLIFALGDGHGASECFRSSIGSEFVCKEAEKKLKEFALSVEENALQDDLIGDGKKQEILVRHLIQSIFAAWIDDVDKEFRQNAMTEEECGLAGIFCEQYRNGEKIEHIYGTTLLAGLLTEDYLLLLQQGDGHCDVFDERGNVFQPIPWDERCFANVTTSVCDSDAMESCRYCVIDIRKTPVVACFAGSDGVEDSFPSMDKLHAYYRSAMMYACENGVDALETEWETSLSTLSKEGSGDDITVCGFIDLEAVVSLTERLEKDNEITALNGIIKRADEKMQSMSRKLSILENNYLQAEKEYNLQVKKYEDAVADYEKTLNELNALNDRKETTEFLEQLKNFFSARSLQRFAKTLETSLHESEELKKIEEEKLIAVQKVLENKRDEYFSYKKIYDDKEVEKEDAVKKLMELT